MLFQSISQSSRSLRQVGYGFLTLLSACLTVMGGMHPAHAVTLTSWEFDPQTNQAIFTLTEKATPEVFLLTDPLRIVVDFPNTKIAEITTQRSYIGAVTEVRASQFTEETARVVLELNPNTRLSPEQVELNSLSGNRWLLRPQIAVISSTPSTDLPLPPAQPPLAPANITVNVPPLPPQDSSASQTEATQTPIIQFGQPLPALEHQSSEPY